MKKLFKGLLVAAMALTVTACGGNEKETTDTQASSGKEVKEINIAVSPDYPPYESLDTDGNTLLDLIRHGCIISRVFK